MILRVFLLFALAIVIALFCRAFLMRARFKKDLQNEKAKMEELLQSILKAQTNAANSAAQNNQNNPVEEIVPCKMCGVCLPVNNGVRDSNGNFFCSPLHLEMYQKDGTR